MRIRRTIALTGVIATVSGCAAGRISSPYSALCAYHLWRAAHDVSSGHGGWAAFQAWRTVNDCPRSVR
jgi:hypothetical protein